jgi:hypothetical protein
MAIVDLVNYDQTVTLDLKTPKGDPVNVSFEVRSIDNIDAQNLMRQRRAKAMSGMAQKGKDKPNDDDLAALLIDMIEPDGEILATCVTGWNWNGQEFESGKGVLEWSEKNARYVLTHPSTRWMRPQVQAAAQGIDVFTKA